MSEETEKFGKGKDIIEKDSLLEEGLDPELVEKITLQLNDEYRDKIQNFKDDYNTYMQTGRHVSSTHVRRIKKRDLLCFINLETDTLLIERVVYCDGINIRSKTYEYPVALVKTIQIKLFPLLNVQSRIVIHLAISNIHSLDIASKVRSLADSVFLKNILRYQDKRLGEKPIMQIIIAGAVFGLVAYFVLLQVFKKAIIRILGDMTLQPPTE